MTRTTYPIDSPVDEGDIVHTSDGPRRVTDVSTFVRTDEDPHRGGVDETVTQITTESLHE